MLEDSFSAPTGETLEVIRFEPGPNGGTGTATVSFEVETPSLWCTCPALGGPELDTLYVTSLSSNPDADEEAGNLFRAKVLDVDAS